MAASTVSRLHDLQQQFTGCFNDDPRPQWRQCRVLQHLLPANPIRIVLCFSQRFDGLLPCARSDCGVSAGQICLGDMKIELRLADGFVAGVEQGRGFATVTRAQALLFPVYGVLNVEHAAMFAAIEDETVFHSSDFLCPKL